MFGVNVYIRLTPQMFGVLNEALGDSFGREKDINLVTNH